MAFNTTGQTYTPAELTEQEREDWRSEMGVEKVGVAEGLIDEKIENLGVRNLFSENQNIAPLTGSPTITKEPDINGFKVVGSSSIDSIRINSIIPSNGIFTLSFWVKQINPHPTFSIDFNDIVAEKAEINPTAEYVYHTITRKVTNWNEVTYKFINIRSITSGGLIFKDVKLVKGDITNKEWQPSDGDFAKKNGDITEDFNANIMTANQYLPFTGCHTAPYKDENLKPYTLVRLKQNGFIDDKQPNWEVEPAIKGEKGIFGVVYGLLEKPVPIESIKSEPTPSEPAPRKLIPTNWIIAALGDMPIFVCNENGNIEYGDRLTPSSIQGVAMKSTDLLDPFCGIAGMDVNFKDENDIVKIGITKE